MPQFRFTPRQVDLTKRFLRTCRLNAGDIKSFNAIISAFDNAIDEFPNKNTSNEIQPKKIQSKSQFLPVMESISEDNSSLKAPSSPSRKIPTRILEQQNDTAKIVKPVSNIESNPTVPPNVETPKVENSKSHIDSTIDSPIQTNDIKPPNASDITSSIDEIDKAGVFGVIDKRTNKGEYV